MTSETWRCQPCQGLVSLWSSPSSFLAVSKLSSIAQRWPATLTNTLIPVPAGHQVVKNARSPSAILRLIDIADTVNAVGGNPGERNVRCDRAGYHLNRERGLGRKARFRGTCALSIRAGSPVQLLGKYSARSIKA